ncbi:MAG: hypothetical protein DBX47_05935 [Clostridiales bacterium]|nr:MAG: hypothetical protein DBX47_05935 [Clostridiales bacterium]
MENTIIFENEKMFSVPVKIVDSYLSAPETELRLILFLLRNQNTSFTKNDILTALGVDEQRADKAFEYWCKAGILYSYGNRFTLERPKIAASEIMKYSADQIAKRIEEDDGVRFLHATAEKILRKPLSTADSSIILSLMDWDGLPPEVAALLIQYAAEQGFGLSRIQKMGIEWAEKEINTYDKAEAYVTTEAEKRNHLNAIARLLGISHRALTEAEKKIFTSWNTELGYGAEMIRHAYDETIKNTGKYSYQYMDKILTSWRRDGFKCVEDTEKASSEERKVVRGAKKTMPKNTAGKKKQKGDWDIIMRQLEEGTQDEEE